MRNQNYAEFKPKTRLQLADEYGINYKTLMRKLKKSNISLPKGNVFPKNQKLIYERLGYPNTLIKEIYQIA